MSPQFTLGLVRYFVRSRQLSVATLAYALNRSVKTAYRIAQAGGSLPSNCHRAAIDLLNRLIASRGCSAGIHCEGLAAPARATEIDDAERRRVVSAMLQMPGKRVALERDGVWPLLVPTHDALTDHVPDDSPLELLDATRIPDIILEAAGVSRARQQAAAAREDDEFNALIDDYQDAIRSNGRRIVIIQRVPALLTHVRSMVDHELEGNLLSLESDPALTRSCTESADGRQISVQLRRTLCELMKNGQSERQMIDALEQFRIL